MNSGRNNSLNCYIITQNSVLLTHPLLPFRCLSSPFPNSFCCRSVYSSVTVPPPFHRSPLFIYYTGGMVKYERNEKYVEERDHSIVCKARKTGLVLTKRCFIKTAHSLQQSDFLLGYNPMICLVLGPNNLKCVTIIYIYQIKTLYMLIILWDKRRTEA